MSSPSESGYENPGPLPDSAPGTPEDLSSPGQNPIQNPYFPIPEASGEEGENATPESDSPIQAPNWPEPPKWAQVQKTNKPYTQYMIDSLYEFFEGRRQLPVSTDEGGDDVSCAIVRIHPTYARRVVRWTCERIGEKPVLPHWDTGNQNEKLAKRDIRPCSTTLTMNGAQVWRVSGTYVYFLEKATPAESKMFCGAPPFDESGPSSQIIDGQCFNMEILKSL